MEEFEELADENTDAGFVLDERDFLQSLLEDDDHGLIREYENIWDQMEEEVRGKEEFGI